MCEVAGFHGFGAVPTIAVDGQADDPSDNLMVANQFAKKVRFSFRRLPMNDLEGTGPRSAWVAQREPYSDGTEVDSRQSTGRGPRRLLLIDLPHSAQLSQIALI